MTFNWGLLLSAVALLWIPQLLPADMNQKIWSGSTRSYHATVSDLLLYPFTWWHFISAASGAYLLTMNADAPAISVDPAIPGAGSRAFFLKAAILTAGLLIQMIRIKRRLILLAPVAYLSGVILALPPFSTGAFAVAVGWVFAAVAKNTMLIIPVMAGSLASAGYLMDGLSLDLMFGSGLAVGPLVLSFVFQKGLLFISRSQPGLHTRPKPNPVPHSNEMK